MLADLELEVGCTEKMVKEMLQKALPEGYELKKVLFADLGKKITLAKYIKGSIYSIHTRGDVAYDTILRQWEPKSNNEISVRQVGEYLYEVKVLGEKNMVKGIFGPEADKFDIASKITIKRLTICAGSWDDDYIAFFTKQIEHFAETTAALSLA